MSNNLSLIPPGPEATGSDGQRPPRQNPRRRPGQAPAPEAAAKEASDPGQRLIIQEVGDTGEFIYTVIDRASGAVVAETSREEVAQMSQKPGYAAGTLIRTSV
jgi:hypothetical protein